MSQEESSNLMSIPLFDTNLQMLVLLSNVEKAHKEETEGWFNNMLQMAVESIHNIDELLKLFEDTYKAQTGATKMPTAYRTAKSVILKGLEYQCIADEEGNLLGKSAIEKGIKEAKATLPLSSAELLGTIIKQVDNIDAILTSGMLLTEDSSLACVYITDKLGKYHAPF